LDSKGIINTVKKGVMSAMEGADVTAFTFSLRLRLLYKFILPEAMVINLFANILRVFLVVLGK